MRIILWLHDARINDPALQGIPAADAIVCASEYIRERVWSLLKDTGCSPAMWVIPYGLDDRCFYPADTCERESLRTTFAMTSGETVLGFASSLAAHKGLHIVLYALGALAREADGLELGPIRVLVAGNESEDRARDYAALARALGVRLDFTGLLPPHRLRGFYCSIDALLVPSVWAEPFGLVALECLACGTTVLASDAGGLREICLDQPNAMLVAPANSPPAWSRALARWLRSANSRAERQPRYTTLETFAGEWGNVLKCLVAS